MAQGVYLSKARYANSVSVHQLQTDLGNFSSARLRRILDGRQVLPAEYEAKAATSVSVPEANLSTLRIAQLGP